jgi:hypothetical protein
VVVAAAAAVSGVTLVVQGAAAQELKGEVLEPAVKAITAALRAVPLVAVAARLQLAAMVQVVPAAMAVLVCHPQFLGQP